MRQVKAGVKWVSVEPLIEPITMDFSLVQWVVIGGASAQPTRSGRTTLNGGSRLR